MQMSIQVDESMTQNLVQAFRIRERQWIMSKKNRRRRILCLLRPLLNSVQLALEIWWRSSSACDDDRRYLRQSSQDTERPTDTRSQCHFDTDKWVSITVACAQMKIVRALMFSALIGINTERHSASIDDINGSEICRTDRSFSSDLDPNPWTHLENEPRRHGTSNKRSVSTVISSHIQPGRRSSDIGSIQNISIDNPFFLVLGRFKQLTLSKCQIIGTVHQITFSPREDHQWDFDAGNVLLYLRREWLEVEWDLWWFAHRILRIVSFDLDKPCKRCEYRSTREMIDRRWFGILADGSRTERMSNE